MDCWVKTRINLTENFGGNLDEVNFQIILVSHYLSFLEYFMIICPRLLKTGFLQKVCFPAK